MKMIIDRFEGEYAVVELDNKKFVNIPKEALPPDVKDGDVIEIIIRLDESRRRKERISGLVGDLWKD